MNTSDWITISDYSSKFRVSVSTLRRKIKSKSCEYIFDEGKYFLKNKPLKDHKVSSTTTKPLEPVPAVAPPLTSAQVQARSPGSRDSSDAVSLDSMNRGFSETARELLSELKGAYALILQEKEEIILQLKDEVADLKTLTRILEDENTRLKESLAKAQSIDQWLGSIET